MPCAISSLSPVTAEGWKSGKPSSSSSSSQHGETSHARMVAKPSQDFVAPRLLWKIGRDIDERNAPVPSAEETGGIVTPGGRQHDLCPCPLQHRMKTRNQLGVSNVGKF